MFGINDAGAHSSSPDITDYDPMCGPSAIEARYPAFENELLALDDQPNRANNENQNDGQQHGVFGEVLTWSSSHGSWSGRKIGAFTLSRYYW